MGGGGGQRKPGRSERFDLKKLEPNLNFCRHGSAAWFIIACFFPTFFLNNFKKCSCCEFKQGITIYTFEKNI